MPIRPENRRRYGADWDGFARALKDEAGWRCECVGECGRGTHDGRCPNAHDGPAYRTGSRVVLTVAHLCHEPRCRDRSHLRVMCQGCHLHYDREHHADTRAVTSGMVPDPIAAAVVKAVPDPRAQIHQAVAELGARAALRPIARLHTPIGDSGECRECHRPAPCKTARLSAVDDPEDVE